MAYANFEGAIQAHIMRCLIAIDDQEELVRELHLTNNSVLRESAERTLGAMYHTLEIARNAQASHARSLKRKLCCDLMMQFAKRGALLSTLSRADMQIIVRNVNLSEFSAWACIELHQNWRFFVLAERWNDSMKRLPPTTVDEAIFLVRKWKRIGQPEPV